MSAKAYLYESDCMLPTIASDGAPFLREVIGDMGGFKNVIIVGGTFDNLIFMDKLIQNVKFVECVFNNVTFSYVKDIKSVVFDRCTITGSSDWTKRKGITMIDSGQANIQRTNDEIAKIVHGKVYSLPNKDYVKVAAECDFCHNTFFEIMNRNKPRKILLDVPQCDKQVCEQCYRTYDLNTKAIGHRTYGYRGSLSFYKTPMDARNTEILGLEMEFEGDFWNWKGLQDAHRGHLHYGYDSSVEGQNELSWDCGSYSYWKYLAPLADVCSEVEKGGGHAGPTAGIHIHVSAPDTDVCAITEKINAMCRDGTFKTLMECVSLRQNRAKFETYANLGASISAHHAGISFNSHGTCEFRVFNSTLDPKLILRHLKFCKEMFHLVKTKVPTDKILESFSKETKQHIITCAKTQADSGFVSAHAAKLLIKKLGA